MDLLDSFYGVAEVADVLGIGDGLVGEAEEVLEDDAVELDYVELGLAGGDLGVEFVELLGDGLGFGGEEVVGVGGGGYEGYALRLGEGLRGLGRRWWRCRRGSRRRLERLRGGRRCRGRRLRGGWGGW